MENKVGDNVPKQQKLDAIFTKLTSVVAELQEFCITLQSEERTSLLHPRRGGDAKAEVAHDLCTRYDVKVKNVPVDGMLNDLRLARQIRPFLALFQSGLTMVTDTSSQAQSEYWQAFLSLYGALVKSAEHDPMLAAEVQDLVDFMAAHGRKQKAAEAAPKVVAAPAAKAVAPAEPAAVKTDGEPPAK
jgi:hypothetical protein